MAMPWRSFVANTTSSGHRSLAAIADPGLGQIKLTINEPVAETGAAGDGTTAADRLIR